MARKRFMRKAKKAGRKVARYVRRANNPSSGAILQLDAMAYGAARQHIAGLVVPRVPAFAGEATDEVVMGALCWAAAKYIPNAFVKNVARKGLVIENARVGEFAASALMGQGKTDTSNSQSW